ncbi:TIGR02453 family protein [Rhodococcus hoagii]|nr:TIGR02453 family protein [Prescottella equi]
MFTGFSTTALDFYEDLEADNSKAWWTSHKSVYDTDVRAPMVELLSVLEPEFGPGKAFRPYRDVRFSKDKSPYKTHQGGFVESCPGVGFYVHIDASGLFVAGGHYSHTPEQLARYRAAVDDDRHGRTLERLVRKIEKAGFEIGGDRLATRPRGVSPDHPRIELMRHRSLTAGLNYGCPDWLGTPEAADRIRSAWASMRPLVEWFTDVFGAHG